MYHKQRLNNIHKESILSSTISDEAFIKLNEWYIITSFKTCMSKSTKQLIPYWYMISYRNSYYMQNMWYIATTCIITFTKQCTHRFNMYHQAQVILYYTYWMIHYNNFQKPNDTYKILWNTTNSRISWPSKTLYTLFKMYQQAHLIP